MSGDPQFNNIPLVASFLKYFNRAYLGPAQLAKDSKAEQPSGTPAVETEESEQLPADMTEMVPVEIQGKMRELVVGYFQNAGKTLVKGQIVRFLVANRISLMAYRAIAETSRAGQTQSRSIHQIRRDIRGPSTRLRADDSRRRKAHYRCSIPRRPLVLVSPDPPHRRVPLQVWAADRRVRVFLPGQGRWVLVGRNMG
jgi:hypothetical protein